MRTTGIPSCPKFLQREARESYGRTGNKCARISTLTELSDTPLSTLCLSSTEYLEGTDPLCKSGIVVGPLNGPDTIENIRK